MSFCHADDIDTLHTEASLATISGNSETELNTDHLEMLSSRGAYVKVYFNSFLQDGAKRDAISDVNTCYISCLSSSDCLSMDYDSTSNTCWHNLNDAGCSDPLLKIGSTHFAIRKCNDHEGNQDLVPSKLTIEDSKIHDVMFNMYIDGGTEVIEPRYSFKDSHSTT